MLLLLLVLGSNKLVCDGAKILVLMPTIARSHWMSMEPLVSELAARGHEVTVLGTFPPDKQTPNYTHINIKLSLQDLLEDPDNDQKMFWKMPPFVIIYFMAHMGSIMSEKILSQENAQKLINDQEKQFDVIIYEPFFTEALLGFVHKFKAPSIAFCSFTGDEFVMDTVGNPFPYSYVPNSLLSYSDHMTFLQRLHNTVIQVSAKALFKWHHFPNQDAIMRKYFQHSVDLPSVSELYQNTSLLFTNGHESVSYLRPLLPNVINVGGIHIKQPRKLPEDLQKFIDKSTDGIIYFSMGSNLRSADLPAQMRKAFLNAFSKLKQNVLWKFEEEDLPDLPRNVKISKWFPQNDILAHQNIKLFITHGGMLSTQEATYHGVPVIGIPILGDQKVNMDYMESNECGITLDINNISETSLAWALNEALNNPRYRENMKYRSLVFKDRPHTPMDTAIFWIEYVIRHKGAKHLRSAALDLTWYQYYLLDVITVLVLTVLSSCLFTIMLIKTIIRIFRKKKVTKEKKD